MYEKKKNIPRLLFYFIVLMFLLQAYNNSFKAKKKINKLIHSDMISKEDMDLQHNVLNMLIRM